MKLSKYLLLTWENVIIFIIAEVLSVIFHNVTSGLFRTEEPLFFILSVIIIPTYFILSLVYTIFYIMTRKKVKINKKKKKR